MTSVRVKFRESTVSGKEGGLYFQFIHNRKTKLITTRFRLFPSEWDARLLIVVTENADNERAAYLQNIKEGVEAEIRQVRALIAMLEKRGGYTTKELAECYVDNSFNGYFFSFISHQVRMLKEAGQAKTASIYETVQRSFSRFRHGEDIWINKIDGSLMRQYEMYLKSNGVGLNSISCYMRALRATYYKAVQKGLAVSRNPFKEVYTGIEKTAKRAVNEEVITALIKLDLSEFPRLQFARDLFMFSFYTRGMSFVDMANLRQSNLKNGYILYARSKTKQMLTIKIERCIDDIIKRYHHATIGEYVLPICNTQNQDYSSHLRTYNKRLKRLSEMLGLGKTLSSYVARHSWATIALRKGISVQVISEGMGHEDEKTTRIYLASLDQSVIDNANAQIIAL